MQIGIIVPRETATHAFAIGIDDTTGPPFALPVACLEMSNDFPLGSGRQNFLPEDSSTQLGPPRISQKPLELGVLAFSLWASDISSPPYFDFQL